MNYLPFHVIIENLLSTQMYVIHFRVAWIVITLTFIFSSFLILSHYSISNSYLFIHSLLCIFPCLYQPAENKLELIPLTIMLHKWNFHARCKLLYAYTFNTHLIVFFFFFFVFSKSDSDLTHLFFFIYIFFCKVLVLVFYFCRYD